MDNEKLSIRLNINDRFYPLTINLEDEEKIRKASKDINNMIAEYRKKYTNTDGQDLLAMVALQLKIRSMDLESNQDLTEVINDIKTINRNIELFLSE